MIGREMDKHIIKNSTTLMVEVSKYTDVWCKIPSTSVFVWKYSYENVEENTNQKYKKMQTHTTMISID